jgi:hypothetical protein
VGLERCPLSLVSTPEELLERRSSGSFLENREYSRTYPRSIVYPQKLALTSLTSGGRSSVELVHGLRPRSLVVLLYLPHQILNL